MIPHGLPILVSPAGTTVWSPTDGTTPQELRGARATALADISHARATVDGHRLHLTFVKGQVHNLRLHPGNLIQAVDPAVTGHTTKVLSADWLAWIRHLSRGHHTVVLSTHVGADLLDITFHLKVT